jgi:hypothetical protein
MICMKVETPGCKLHKFADGSIGFLYKFDDATPRTIPQPRQEKPVIETPMADLSRRDAVYRAMLQLAFYEMSDEQWRHLLEKRRIPEEQIRNFGELPSDKAWREMVCRELLKEFDLWGVPGFFEKYMGVWTIGGPAGILIPYFSREGMIQGFQIRIPDAVKNKYRWLSTHPEDYNKGTASGTYLNFTRHTHHDQIWICEGGLKAVIAANLSGKMFIGLPALHIVDVEALEKLAKDWGCEFVLCPDADFQENEHVYRGWFNNIITLTNIARTRVAIWPPEDGKGVDDYLMKSGKLPKILSTKAWLDKFPPPRRLAELLMAG